MYKYSIVILLSLISYLTVSGQSWIQIANFPGGERDDGCVFTINNKAYCYTGLEPGWNCQVNGFVFDGNSETWSSMASLPSGKERQYATSFSFNGIGYLLGGLYCTNACMNDFWSYSVSTNSWTPLPDFPGTGRQGMSNFIIKNKAYVIGGRDQSNATLHEVWEYDFISMAWTQKNDLPFAGMWRGAAFAIDSTGYVCYGMNSNANSFNHFMYKYNILNDIWSMVPNVLLPARNYISCAVANKKACLYGGQDSLSSVTNNLYVFDPADTSLVSYTGIPTIGRKGGMTFSLNDVFYTTTGLDADGMRIKETWKNADFVGIKENESMKNNLDVYPNPCQERLLLKFGTLINGTIQLFNQLGEVVFEEKIENHIVAINTTPYVDGIYYLSVHSNDVLSITKVVINH